MAEERRRPSTFLALAPTTSNSNTSNPTTQSSVSKTLDQTSATADDPSERLEATPAPVAGVDPKTRRSSSLSSDGSMQKQRFLKLGHVQFGEAHGNDWSEEVIE